MQHWAALKAGKWVGFLVDQWVERKVEHWALMTVVGLEAEKESQWDKNKVA